MRISYHSSMSPPGLRIFRRSSSPGKRGDRSAREESKAKAKAKKKDHKPVRWPPAFSHRLYTKALPPVVLHSNGAFQLDRAGRKAREREIRVRIHVFSFLPGQQRQAVLISTKKQKAKCALVRAKMRTIRVSAIAISLTQPGQRVAAGRRRRSQEKSGFGATSLPFERGCWVLQVVPDQARMLSSRQALRGVLCFSLCSGAVL